MTDGFRKHQPVILTLVVGLLIGCLIIFVILFSLQSWRDNKAKAVDDLYNVMELESQAIDSYFTRLENVMRVFARDLGDLGTADELAQGFVLVQRFLELRPEFFNIMVLRADGQILFTAKDPPAPGLPTLAQEPSFQQFKEESDKGRDLIIGRPMAVTSKQWIIPFRYILRDTDGRLRHVISANLPLTFLQDFWKKASFTKKASLGLLRDDGFLLSRYPVPADLDLATIYGQPRTGILIRHLREQNFPPKGYVEGPSSLDGPDFLTSYLRLENFPLTLFIAMPASEIRNAWWDDARMFYTLAAAILAAGIAFYFFSLAEEAKRKSGELYRSMFEQTCAVKLLIDDKNTTIVDANEAACTFYGYSREQLLGMPIALISTLSPEQLQAEITKSKNEGQGYFLHRHRLANGEFRNVEVYAGPLEIEGRILLYSIIHDITDRLRAERALEESKREYDEMVARVPVGIYRLRMTTAGVTTFEYVSPRWCALTQLNGNAVLGDAQLAYDRIHPDDLPGLLEAEEAARRDLVEFAWQGRLVIDGKVRFMQIGSNPRILENGDILWAGILADITEIKKNEEELKSLNEELERRVEVRTQELQEAQSQFMHIEKLSAIGKLSASIAHEFNSPLQAVMTFLKGLRLDSQLNDGERKLLETAIGESERMKNLVRNLQDFYRPSTGSKTLIDLHATIDSLLMLYKGDLFQKNIQIELHHADMLPHIMAVPDQIKQVFLNLLNNAAEACHNQEGIIAISTWRESDKVAVAIRDNGIGIKPADMEHIFRPFFSTKAEVKGTGLGLSVSYGIIKKHGGEIRVDSEPGKGTTFTVLLPINSEEDSSDCIGDRRSVSRARGRGL